MTAEKIRLHELTDRQRRILDYVTLSIIRDDRSPSLREIADACDVSSTSVVDYNVDRLIERGLLVRTGAYGDQRRVSLPVNPWRQLVDDANGIFEWVDDIVNEKGPVARAIASWRERRAKFGIGELFSQGRNET